MVHESECAGLRVCPVQVWEEARALCVPCWVVFLGRVLVYTGEVCRQDSEYTG